MMSKLTWFFVGIIFMSFQVAADSVPGICPENSSQGISTSEEAMACAEDWYARWDFSVENGGPQNVLGVLKTDTRRLSGPSGRVVQGVPAIQAELGQYVAAGYLSWNLIPVSAVPFGENGFATEYRGTATVRDGEAVKTISAWGSDWIRLDSEGKIQTWSGYYNDENSAAVLAGSNL